MYDDDDEKSSQQNCHHSTQISFKEKNIIFSCVWHERQRKPQEEVFVGWEKSTKKKTF